MGAPDLMRHLRDAGLALTLTPTGDLHVAPRSALTDQHRAAIRTWRDALVQALLAEARELPTPPPRQSGNPWMTPEQGDACHTGGWSDAEIDAFQRREARLLRLGRADAEYLAERLTLRDRDGDDRRLCLECTWLSDTGRCMAAATGRLPGVDRRLKPLPTLLQRCDAFGLSKGLV